MSTGRSLLRMAVGVALAFLGSLMADGQAAGQTSFAHEANPALSVGQEQSLAGVPDAAKPMLQDDPASTAPRPFVMVRLADEPRDATEYFRPLSPQTKTLAALRQPTELDFLDQPLETVLDAIESQAGISIELDESDLEEVAITSDAEVTVQLRDMSLATALGLMLRDLDLDYVAKEDYVLITSRERQSAMRETRTYAVADHPLLRGEDSLKFAQTLRKHVELTCSRGAESVAIDVLPGALLVTADQRAQEAAEKVLQQYALVLAAYDSAEAETTPPGLPTLPSSQPQGSLDVTGDR